MQNEQKKRLEKFRKVSGRLLWFTMPLLIIFTLAGTIAWMIFLFKPLGNFGLVEILAKVHNSEFIDISFKENLTFAAKSFCAAYGAITIATITYILFHFHSVLECFFDGHIFNFKTLTHARKAYKMNLWSVYFELSVQIIAIIVTALTIKEGVAIQIGHFANSVLFNAITIGFLSLLLWALEMGTDLNQDAELTI